MLSGFPKGLNLGPDSTGMMNPWSSALNVIVNMKADRAQLTVN
jgi:hypothetical protein